MFTWSITALNCKPQEGSLTDVVITAHWSCYGQQDDCGADVYGTCAFSQPGDPFTPYDQLTQDQVLGWCWASGVDKDAIEAQIQSQINNMINAPVVAPPLPWVPAPAAD